MFHKRTSTSTKRKLHLYQNANRCRTISKQKPQMSTNRMCGYSKGFGKTKEKRAIQMMAPLQPHCFLLQTTLRKTTTTYHGAHTDDMFWTSHWSVGFADIANTANPTSRIRSYKFYEGIQKALNIQAQQKNEGSRFFCESWKMAYPAASCWNQLLDIYEMAFCLLFEVSRRLGSHVFLLFVHCCDAMLGSHVTTVLRSLVEAYQHMKL